jgi:hypothetical protein
MSESARQPQGDSPRRQRCMALPMRWTHQGCTKITDLDAQAVAEWNELVRLHGQAQGDQETQGTSTRVIRTRPSASAYSRRPHPRGSSSIRITRSGSSASSDRQKMGHAMEVAWPKVTSTESSWSVAVMTNLFKRHQTQSSGSGYGFLTSSPGSSGPPPIMSSAVACGSSESISASMSSALGRCSPTNA